MTISSYSELQTAAQNWLARTDADIVARIPEFVDLVEARLTWGNEDPEFPSPALRCRQMENRATADTSGEFLALPSDYIEMIRLKLDTDPVTFLRYVTRNDFDQRYVSSQTGKPVAFTVEGSELRFGPSPSATYSVEMLYYQAIPALSDSNTTNWILTAAPNIYLYGVLIEAAPYIGEDDRVNVAVWYRAFTAAVRALNGASRMSNLGGNLEMTPGITAI